MKVGMTVNIHCINNKVVISSLNHLLILVHFGSGCGPEPEKEQFTCMLLDAYDA